MTTDTGYSLVANFPVSKWTPKARIRYMRDLLEDQELPSDALIAVLVMALIVNDEGKIDRPSLMAALERFV